MSDNPFYRLSPFIQEYIYAHGWAELRAVQVEACRVILDTTAHLLLATGTASGKTEAAFLPILTLLQQNPSATVGVLYIGPTKALINDQFVRLNDLLRDADIPVWHWHGDVSPGEKSRLLKAPQGVLQITPESLESLLINRAAELVRILGDLRFVVIDEVHVFMSSDRGRQILCQLARLSRYMRKQPRRVGLSATLGDYSLAAAWLAAGTDSPVMTPDVQTGPKKVRLAVENLVIADADQADDQARAAPADCRLPPRAEMTDQTQALDAYHRYVFDASRGRKCLIFANSRAETESIISGLRQIAERQRLPDVYHVHHGSISAPLREAAENAMRDETVPAVIAATVTLELGIDIGLLERVIQLQSPFSVASFLQRLGRSGRRGNPSEMWLVCQEDAPSHQDLLPSQVPWQLLQSIAIIQLYLEERWIEPLQPSRYPLSLLYHQTMSTLAALGELTPAALAQRVLTLPPFQPILQSDYQSLLRHLVETDHIQQTEEGKLIIGLAGERVVRNFRFYAVFPDNEEYAVREESKEIGSIMMPPPPGERFALAGHTWEVQEVEPKRKVVYVKRVGGRARASWTGSGGSIHSRVLQRMRRALLCEEAIYPYLQPGAIRRLEEARQLARSAGLAASHIVPLGGSEVCIFPWMGTTAYQTLQRVLRFLYKEALGINAIDSHAPYFLILHLQKANLAGVRNEISLLAQREISSDELLGPDEAPQMGKYDEFVPSELLRKAFVADWLDVSEMKAQISQW